MAIMMRGKSNESKKGHYRDDSYWEPFGNSTRYVDKKTWIPDEEEDSYDFTMPGIYIVDLREKTEETITKEPVAENVQEDVVIEKKEYTKIF